MGHRLTTRSVYGPVRVEALRAPSKLPTRDVAWARQDCDCARCEVGPVAEGRNAAITHWSERSRQRCLVFPMERVTAETLGKAIADHVEKDAVMSD